MFSTRKMLRVAIVSGVVCSAVFMGTGAVSASSDPGVTKGTHVPATVVKPKNCDSIPADADPNVLAVLKERGNARGVSDKVRLAMYEAAWVESHANNLPCGDADSVGVFQQRPSQGWCDPASLCQDVPHATNKFLDQAIPNDGKYATAGELAQSVQRSAYPDRYNEAEGKARELMAR